MVGETGEVHFGANHRHKHTDVCIGADEIGYWKVRRRVRKREPEAGLEVATVSQSEHDARKESQDKAIADALSILGEHFEAVHIMASVTTDDDGGTSLRSMGIGNYYTRLGMMHEFIENARAEEIASQLRD